MLLFASGLFNILLENRCITCFSKKQHVLGLCAGLLLLRLPELLGELTNQTNGQQNGKLQIKIVNSHFDSVASIVLLEFYHFR